MILSGFPRRSETFALNEVLALEKRQALAGIFATKPGESNAPQPSARQLQERVQLLPQGSPQVQATFIVQQMQGRKVSGVHGYFAHAPAEVAAHAAAQLHRPYGFSTHAKDARKVEPNTLARRAGNAACVIACNPDVAEDLRRTGVSVRLIPHGVDTKHFWAAPLPPPEPLRLLAVGRMVEKKGFHVLLAALPLVRAPFVLRIVGEGPEETRLRSIVADLGLSERVVFCGPRTHEELPAEYQGSHLLVAPSIVDRAGDRDGLPNVVLEAMACGRAVVGTNAGAISAALRDGSSGLLVPQNDSPSLANAIDSIAFKPEILHAFGERGRELVMREYDLERCSEIFCRTLQEAYA
jgi:glycosyltransferase involved in cell wall biosynthesis